MRVSRAIDLWIGELARAGRTASTRASYERYLFKFLAQLEQARPDVDVRDVTTNDCRHFLDGWNGRSASTVCSHSALSGLSAGSTWKATLRRIRWLEFRALAGRERRTSTS